MIKLDAIDRRILRSLQQDASQSLATLAEEVGLSQTPCWKRVRRLELEGIIGPRVALLNRELLGLGVTVFVSIRTSEHNTEWLENFATAVSAFPEVIELYRMSGQIDYLLKVVCADIAGYDTFYKKLTRATQLLDVSASFAMEQIKCTTQIPI